MTWCSIASQLDKEGLGTEHTCQNNVGCFVEELSFKKRYLLMTWICEVISEDTPVLLSCSTTGWHIKKDVLMTYAFYCVCFQSLYSQTFKYVREMLRINPKGKLKSLGYIVGWAGRAHVSRAHVKVAPTLPAKERNVPFICCFVLLLISCG